MLGFAQPLSVILLLNWKFIFFNLISVATTLTLIYPAYYNSSAFRWLLYKLPRSLYNCSTLVSLELILASVITIKPTSNCFPRLKFPKVYICCPIDKSMDKLVSCCPVLEDLIVDGGLELVSSFTINISARKLKTLEIRFNTLTTTILTTVCATFLLMLLLQTLKMSILRTTVWQSIL